MKHRPANLALSPVFLLGRTETRAFDRVVIAGPWRARRAIPQAPGGRIKRVEDIAIALIALMISLPALLAIARAIRLDSRGPALFRQRRTGFDGRDFQMLKFRTLHHHL